MRTAYLTKNGVRLEWSIRNGTPESRRIEAREGVEFIR